MKELPTQLCILRGKNQYTSTLYFIFVDGMMNRYSTFKSCLEYYTIIRNHNTPTSNLDTKFFISLNFF